MTAPAATPRVRKARRESMAWVRGSGLGQEPNVTEARPVSLREINIHP
jgi:hypothetical protein